MRHLISINIEVEGPSPESLGTEPGSDTHMQALSSAIHTRLADISLSGNLLGNSEYVEGVEDEEGEENRD